MELPKGKLERLARGDISAEALSEAFGAQAGAEIAAFFQQGNISVQANVQPDIHYLQGCFFTVAGKRLLLGSSDIQVEVSRKKLLAGNHITALPDKGRQLWSKTDLQVNCASSEQGPFANKNLSFECAVNKTPQGFDYTIRSNLPDILPALERQGPMPLDDMPLFGSQKPLYSLVLSPQLLAAFSRVTIMGIPDQGFAMPPTRQIPADFDAVERIGIFWGGTNAQVFGCPVPGVTLALKGKPEITAMLQAALTGTAPVQWGEKKIEGWDAFFTADMIVVEQMPIPMPLFFGRKGGNFLCGIINHEELGLPQDSDVILAHLPEGVKTNAFADMDLQGLWAAGGAIMNQGSALRLLSQIDATWSPAQVKAVENLLHTPLPVQRVTGWSSPDMRHVEGRVILDPSDSGAFVSRLCELVDVFF